jgi:WD40 repeat protein
MDVASGEPQKAIRCEFEGRTVFSPDGKLAAVEHDDLIYLLDTATGHAIGYLPGKALWAHTISFGPNGVLVAVSKNNNINIALWDIMKLQATTELPGHSKGVQVLAFNPDGTILASGGVDAEIRLWNTGTGKELARLIDGTKGADSVFALAFSPDGKTLAAGYTGRIIVWMAR